MDAQEIRGKLRGVIAFPVTPFKADYSLDIAGLRSNLKGLMEYAVSAVVAAGRASRSSESDCGRSWPQGTRDRRCWI
jgi:hypothetical protein